MRISDWSSDVCSSDLPGGDILAAREAGIVERRRDVHRITIGRSEADEALRLHRAVAGFRGQLLDLQPVARETAVDDDIRQLGSLGLILIGHVLAAPHAIEAGVGAAEPDSGRDRARTLDLLIARATKRKK